MPLTAMRRRIAQHMVHSRATSAHAFMVMEGDFEEVDRVRAAHGPAFRVEEGFALGYLPFIACAVARALREWPRLNASVGSDALLVHRKVNLGMAVDLGYDGILVPVVARADELGVREMARAVHDLVDRARRNRLRASEVAGGTFTVTNIGPFGALLTAPIINQPQVGILSSDAVRRRPVVVTDGGSTERIVAHSIGNLCLSWDHRAVDGAYAAGFLGAVRRQLGSRDWARELASPKDG